MQSSHVPSVHFPVAHLADAAVPFSAAFAAIFAVSAFDAAFTSAAVSAAFLSAAARACGDPDTAARLEGPLDAKYLVRRNGHVYLDLNRDWRIGATA